MTLSIPTGTDSDSLSENDRCLLRQFTFLFWTSRSFTSLNNLLRPEVAQKRCSPNSTRAFSRSMLTPRTSTYMPSPCSHRPRHRNNLSSSSLTRRSATHMNCSTDTSRTTSPHLHRRTASGQALGTQVPNRSASNFSPKVVKTNHPHLSIRTCQPSNTTPRP